MGRSFLVITSLLGFLTGVLLYLVLQPKVVYLIALIILFFIFCLLSRRIRIPLYTLFLFILFINFGLLRSSLSIYQPTESELSFYNESQVEIKGVIYEVDIRRDKVKYKIRVDQLSTIARSSPQSQYVSGNLLISLNKYPQFKYGDRVKVIGELKTPEDFNGFAYSDYLSRYGIYSVMYRPRVYLIEVDQGNLFWQAMTLAQNTFMQRINFLFPEPYASFEAGLLVGARKGIHPDLMEQFNITGLTHIIAISGYNITLIIIFVMAALSRFPRKIAFVIAIISIILFTLFVGASPAVVRASIMGILGLMALYFGRQNNIHITILFSAAFMVLWNPKILWWDVGFQLSFMAVMGLIYIAPLFDKCAKLLPESMGIRESIQMTLAAQVMALPIIVFNFGRLSLIAPLANLLVAFALPLAMLLGFIAVVLSFFLFELSLIFAYLTSVVLEYIIQVIKWTSKVPYASLDLPGMRLWVIVVYYILLTLFLFWWNKRVASDE